MTKVARKDPKVRSVIDMEFPFQVELPESELKGYRVTDMQRFCAMFEHIRRLEKRTPDFFVRWCFKQPEPANQFRQIFGGTRIDLPDDYLWKTPGRARANYSRKVVDQLR